MSKNVKMSPKKVKKQSFKNPLEGFLKHNPEAQAIPAMLEHATPQLLSWFGYALTQELIKRNLANRDEVASAAMLFIKVGK